MSGAKVGGLNLVGIAANVTYMSQCTPQICDLQKYGIIHYVPSGTVNILFAFAFAILAIYNMICWPIWKTHTFSLAMFVGMVFEVVGYLSRVALRKALFIPGPFLLQIITLTIGPVFFTGALYLTLSRIIMHYGAHNSRLSPKAFSITFMFSDFISLILQAAGGAVANAAPTIKKAATGTNIMVGGLAFQVASLVIFIILCADFLLAVKRDQARIAKTNWAAGGVAKPVEPSSLKVLIIAFSGATMLILIRSCYRVAELSHGFLSPLANDQTTFVLFESCAMLTATFLMSAFHPGLFLKSTGWRNSGWGVPRKPAPMLHKEVNSETSTIVNGSTGNGNGEFQEVPFNRPWPMGQTSY